MVIYPAVDLKEGKVVRLNQGDFQRETVYSVNPLDQAEKFTKEGAEWLHIVDLDGARDGKNRNGEIVKTIQENTSLKIQLGGGIRSLARMEYWLSSGIERLVIGTLALKEPEVVAEAVQKFGTERIVVAVDARDGILAAEGWVYDSERMVPDFVREMKGIGVRNLLYTDINRDGMLAGPDLDMLKFLLTFAEMEIIASGGVGSFGDIVELNQVGIHGVIIGQALYTGILNFSEIVQKFGDRGC